MTNFAFGMEQKVMQATDRITGERDLLLALAAGDEEAFCELYAAYKSRLFYFAMCFLKSHEYAEDILQDAFTVVWQSRRFINPDMPFSSYIYTIVRNRILNQLRDMEGEERLKQQILSQAVDCSHDAYGEILFNDLRGIIAVALRQLTPRQREIFEMSRERQMSHQEIAEALGLSVYTVQEHISAALRLLRTYLRRHYGIGADLLLLLVCLSCPSA